MPRLSGLVALALVAIAFAFPTSFRHSQADAQTTARATLYVVNGAIPASVTTAAALLRHARGHRARNLPEQTNAPLAERHWRGSVVMTFSRPVGVRNLTMLTYDITGGQRVLTGNSVDIFVRDVNDTSLVTDFDLARPRFRPNQDIEFVVTSVRTAIGSARVHLTGEIAQGNGSLDFTQADPDHPTARR